MIQLIEDTDIGPRQLRSDHEGVLCQIFEAQQQTGKGRLTPRNEVLLPLLAEPFSCSEYRECRRSSSCQWPNGQWESFKALGEKPETETHEVEQAIPLYLSDLSIVIATWPVGVSITSSFLHRCSNRAALPPNTLA